VGSARRAVPAAMLAVVIAAVLAAAGCGNLRSPGDREAPGGRESPEGPASGGRVRIVTTVFALGEFAGAVGGDRVAVEYLVPAGGHAHEFEPTPRDLERILDADIFLYNGAGFEPWVEHMLARVQGARVRAVDASQGIDLLEAGGLEAGEPDEAGGGSGTGGTGVAGGAVDPHVWLDPLRAARQVSVIADAVAAVDPAGAAAYRANRDAYVRRLEELDRRWAAALGGCRVRDFVAEHGAYGYLADRYGLRQVAVTGLASDQDPTPRRLAEIAALMAERGIGVVYREPGSTTGVAEALAAETGARVLLLDPLETPGAAAAVGAGAGAAARAGAGATPGAAAEAPGEAYLAVMERNLEALAQGLDCASR